MRYASEHNKTQFIKNYLYTFAKCENLGEHLVNDAMKLFVQPKIKKKHIIWGMLFVSSLVWM